MPAQRLQKGDEYTKKLVRFTPEMCALIQSRADASHLSFNAALMQYLQDTVTPEELRALARKGRKARVPTRRTPTPAP